MRALWFRFREFRVSGPGSRTEERCRASSAPATLLFTVAAIRSPRLELGVLEKAASMTRRTFGVSLLFRPLDQLPWFCEGFVELALGCTRALESDIVLWGPTNGTVIAS